MRALLPLLVLLLLPACRDRTPAAPTEAPAAVAGDACIFRYAIPEAPGSLDPAQVRSGLEGLVAPNLFEGLMVYPEADGAVRPGVAERHAVSADGLTWTFHLRGDARWSDGEPVTAHDFVYAWRRVLAPATASPYADILHVIEGAAAFHRGETQDFGTVGLSAPDDRTVVVRLREPTPYFAELTAFYTYLPVPRRAVEAHGDRWTRAEHIVTNGPFRLDRYDLNEMLVLAKNPTYWDAKSVGADRLEIRIVNDGNTAVNLFESNQLDWTGLVDLPSVRLRELVQWPAYRTDPWLATHYLRLNTRQPPFDDPRVRQAVSLAIDRDTLAKVIRGGNEPAPAFVPPMPGWTVTRGPDLDVERARALLAEAGYGVGRPLAFRLHYPNDELRRLLAQLVAAQLKKHLNAEASLWVEEFRVYLRTQDEGRYQASLSRWAADYSDPTTFLDMWTTASLQNKTGWSDAEYDSLLKKAHGTVDEAPRTQVMQQAEVRVLDAAPIVPLIFGGKAFLLRGSVTGLGKNSLGNHLMKYVGCR